MEVDTGASVSVISETTYRSSLWTDKERPPLRDSTARLRTYTGEPIDVLGEIVTDVKYRTQKKQLKLLVVRGDGPSLLGRDWLMELRLEWREIRVLRSAMASLDAMLERHRDVFKDELGKIQGVEAKIQVEPDAQPRYYRSRSVPYALRGKVMSALERLEKDGIIEPVQHSSWAAPIVPIVKRDGSIRLCGDYKVTVNQVAKRDTFPLPRIEDIFASLEGGKSFSKLDLAHAYLQIPLEESSKVFVTINTPKGLFRYNRLPFGVSAAPSIFQRTMENLLQGIPHTSVYLDDILVTGSTEEEHLRNLDQVLTRLEDAGMRLKRSKCEFMLSEVEYLGHRISSRGLQPTEEKVRAVARAPAPENKTQLQSFLGLINYYAKFLPNLSTTLAPLYALLQKKTVWAWGDKESRAFEKARSQLTSSSLLVHYCSSRELLLACDASPYGVGAVLSHRMEDGTDKPIAFASRSLTPAERNYAQLDREALAIVFGVTKFRQYLLGRRFTILSDHKPLKYLFGETKAIPAMASARIQRWALILGAYDYAIEYKAGEQHANADVLSRLPLPDVPQHVPTPGETVLLMQCLEATPVNAKQIEKWTTRDPLLAKVRKYVTQGWEQADDSEELKIYASKKLELSVEEGCLLWGQRVVVPPSGRQRVIDELHEGHPGTSRMKSLARSYVWWPGLDSDIVAKVQACATCQLNQKSPAPAPLQPWDWPERPWSRVHADYAGSFLGRMFLILVDAHSKWIEIHPVASASSQVTIEKMRTTFASLGLPDLLVTDNGTVFTSSEFQEFLSKNGIRHSRTSPYHPSSNGLAERAVQSFKEGMKKNTQGTIETRLARFLFHYRITPHTDYRAVSF